MMGISEATICTAYAMLHQKDTRLAKRRKSLGLATLMSIMVFFLTQDTAYDPVSPQKDGRETTRAWFQHEKQKRS